MFLNVRSLSDAIVDSMTERHRTYLEETTAEDREIAEAEYQKDLLLKKEAREFFLKNLDYHGFARAIASLYVQNKPTSYSVTLEKK